MEKVKKIFLTATVRHSSITLVSTVINGILGAAFYFLLAKFLGSSDFGIFTVFTASIALVTGIIDLGSDQGIIRFIPKYAAKPDIQKKLIKLSLGVKLVSGLIVVFLAMAFSGKISILIFGKPELSLIIILIGLGVLTQILFSFSTSLSQAFEKYILWGGLFVGTNLIRLIILLVLFQFQSLNVYSVGAFYLLLPFIGFMFSFAFLDKTFLKARDTLSYLPELFTFNKWVTAFVIIATIGSRLEIYFTARYLSLSSLGIYGLAQQVAQILPQLTSAIGAVTSPKFASLNTPEKNINYTAKSVGFSSILAIGSSFLLALIAKVVFNFAGQDFNLAFLPCLVLLLAMVIFFVTAPIRDSIIYYSSKPKFFFFVGLVHAALVSILSMLLIPKFDILGTSLVVLFGQVFIAIISIWYFLKVTKK
jgi:O-antigen/teichoic acid export membrane protein